MVDFRASTSCCQYDYEAIRNTVKPCHIVLKDICSGPNSIQTQKYVPEPLCNETNINNISNTTTSNNSIIPVGLHNPKNHCYINSVLQIISRIFMQFNEEIHTNNNIQGCLVRYLIDSIYAGSENELSQFKARLARFDGFFSGVFQQDAYECLVRIFEIFHVGTKECLIDDAAFLNDDQYIRSLSKRLFLFLYKRSLQCSRCRLISVAYNESKIHFVYPNSDSELSSLIQDSLHTKLLKTCTGCHNDTEHEVFLKFEQSPEFLVILINRFSNSSNTNKNRSRVWLGETLVISSVQYHIIGSIHHHGSSISSGHYTSNIFYENEAYVCNDRQILSLNHLEPSDSAYLVFFVRGH